MSGIVKFGEDVEGYRIPVLNQREIRAAAGILFVLMFAAIALLAVAPIMLAWWRALAP